MRLRTCIGSKEMLVATLVMAIVTQVALISLSIYTAMELKITSGDCGSFNISTCSQLENFNEDLQPIRVKFDSSVCDFIRQCPWASENSGLRISGTSVSLALSIFILYRVFKMQHGMGCCGKFFLEAYSLAAIVGFFIVMVLDSHQLRLSNEVDLPNNASVERDNGVFLGTIFLDAAMALLSVSLMASGILYKRAESTSNNGAPSKYEEDSPYDANGL